MCGVAGFHGQFDAHLLIAMSTAIAHRGPDGQGEWLSVAAEDGVATGFAHRRLAIIDLSSAAAQPMTVRCNMCGAHELNDLALTFNGEIYNYRELRRELLNAGHCLISDSDSEVLLHLYAAKGTEMLDWLNGIFAFAIRDGREVGRPEGVDRGAVFLARDHMGVKPLYVAKTRRGVLFASEIKALLCEPSLSRDIDLAALQETLAYLWSPAPRTILQAVRKIEPGAAMLLHGGRIRREWSYFHPKYAGQLAGESSETLRYELATRVRSAVERQLVADVPVGAFLSGGLDSSAVVAMMAQVLPPEQITCFTVNLNAHEAVEDNPADLPFARRAATHLGVNLVEVDVEPGAILRLNEMIWLMDEPQADPAPINALLIAERARGMGIPVLLSGAGGDDLFGGYRRHWALQFERCWRWLPAVVRRRMQSVAQAMASGRTFGQKLPVLRRAAKMFAYAAEEGDRRLVSYFWWSTDQVRRSLYSPAFADAAASHDVADPLMRTLERIPDEPDPLQRMLMLEARHFLPDHNLNYTDRAGMAVGVEVRVPLIDVDLVSMATRIPSALKQRGRTGKALFKQSMEPYLPREIIYRRKSGFGAPLRRWLRNELRDAVTDVLAPEAIKRRGFFDPIAVSRLIDMDRRGVIDGSYTIFALMSLEMWFRSFLDQKVA